MILIFDIGKTNKKCLVFDEDYRIVFEKSACLRETIDEDGDPCEDLDLLRQWLSDTFLELLKDNRFQIHAVNVTAYGASFVHLDAGGEPLSPLYNYLKPFPDDLSKQFYAAHGAAPTIALETASPVLGNLNSGMQLYWLKYHRPLIFEAINYSLHLPQYIAMLTAMVVCSTDYPKYADNFSASEITSIGCHTMLWDFRKQDYHHWVYEEGIAAKFPKIVASDAVMWGVPRPRKIKIGPGLHDSSSALIPYLACFDEPFILISTGTWCISLNPFNKTPLTAEELAQDCLCYLSYKGEPIKAARYFGGQEHALKVAELAQTFAVDADFYQKPLPDQSELSKEYAAFMRQLVDKQARSTRLVLGNAAVSRIFVDGGFSKNSLYMTFLADAFPQMEVYAAEIPHATALGAAMAIHSFWNPKPMPRHLIKLLKHEISM